MKRKRGSKEAPRCGFCGDLNHYRTSCPKLAAELLAAATKESGVDRLCAHLQSGKPIRLNVARKSQRTAKKAGGKIFKKPTKSPWSKSKAKRRADAQEAHRAKEQKRKPKSVKVKKPKWKVQDVQTALTKLRKSGWLPLKKKKCHCGGNLVPLPLRATYQRGHGRAFQRCNQCRKWFDVMTWSVLPVVKMPLPVIWMILQRYFHGLHAESVESCAKALGLSGSNTSALAKLWRALQTAEVRCMEHKQRNRLLEGPSHMMKHNTFSSRRSPLHTKEFFHLFSACTVSVVKPKI